MNKTVLAWLALALIFGGVMIFAYAAKLFPSQRVPDSISVPDDTLVAANERREPLDGFAFTDQLGRPFHSDSLKGKVWVGSVFFSSCPSVCKTQNMAVAKLQQKYGDKGVEFVSITCDPEADTPAQLLEYGRLFNVDAEKWHMLTGDFDLIKQVGDEVLEITVDKETHSDRLVLFDRSGKVHSSRRSTQIADFDNLCKDIDELLANTVTESHEDESKVVSDTDAEADEAPVPAEAS